MRLLIPNTNLTDTPDTKRAKSLKDYLTPEKLRQSTLPRFILTGGMATTIDFVVYSRLLPALPPVPAKLGSMLCSTLFEFVLNRSWTFRDKEQHWFTALKKYYASMALSIAVNVAVNAVFYKLTGHKIISFCIATLAGTTVNFLLQKYYVFRNRRAAANAGGEPTQAR